PAPDCLFSEPGCPLAVPTARSCRCETLSPVSRHPTWANLPADRRGGMSMFSAVSDFVRSLGSLGFLGEVLVTLGVAVFLGWLTGALRYIRNSRVGVVEKLFSLRGSVRSGLIALGGEAGYQPWVLRGGLHFMMPFQYRVHSVPLVTIPQGQIGYVFARDGQP